jgi:cytochrome c553
MRQTWCAAALGALVPLLAAHAQQIKVQPPNSPTWAFPLITEMDIPEGPEPQSVPGSDRSYTFAQIYDLLNPPDWFPDRHPSPPEIILKGHGRAQACASCHLISGLGRPEMGGLARLPAPYIVQQIADFKSGTRIDAGGRMNNVAQDLTSQEATRAAEWYASLQPQPFTRVVETASVPESFVGPRGGTRFVKPGGGMEPIGARIITLPEDAERVRKRDPFAGYVAYVPVGSLAAGRSLVETGGAGKTAACSVCHGPDMRGLANVPGLAGQHPIYTARQLYLFKDGRRNGAAAARMKAAVERLTDEDIVAISGYLGSLTP